MLKGKATQERYYEEGGGQCVQTAAFHLIAKDGQKDGETTSVREKARKMKWAEWQKYQTFEYRSTGSANRQSSKFREKVNLVD